MTTKKLYSSWIRNMYNSLLVFFRSTFNVDSRSLSLFRIVLGLVSIYRFVTFFPWVNDLLKEDGMLAVQSLNDWSTRWSFYFINPSTTWAWILLLVSVLFSVALTLGYKTKYVTPILWLLAVSFSNRVIGAENSGHAVHRLMLLWSIFLPLDSYWTIEKSFKDTPKKNDTTTISSVAVAGLMIQYIVIYFYAGITKDDAGWTYRFDAVYKTLNVGAFATPFGLWLSNFFTLTKFLTVGALILEIFVPFFILVPFFKNIFRSTAIVFHIIMQIFFGLCFQLGIFPLSMITFSILFIPSGWWDYFRPTIKSSGKFQKLPYSKKHILLSAFGFFFILFTIWSSHHNTYKQSDYRMPKFLVSMADLIRLDQRWWMFTHERWYKYWVDIEGIDAEGNTVVELRSWYTNRGDKEFNYNEPPLILNEFKFQVWNRYLHEAKEKRAVGEWLLFNLCDKYNSQNPDHKIIKAKMYETSSEILGYKSFADPQTTLRNEWDCKE